MSAGRRITLASTGHPKSCAFCAPVMSDVRRYDTEGQRHCLVVERAPSRAICVCCVCRCVLPSCACARSSAVCGVSSVVLVWGVCPLSPRRGRCGLLHFSGASVAWRGVRHRPPGGHGSRLGGRPSDCCLLKRGLLVRRQTCRYDADAPSGAAELDVRRRKQPSQRGRA